MTTIGGTMQDASGANLTGKAVLIPTAVVRDGTLLVPPTPVTIAITDGVVTSTDVRETDDTWRYRVQIFANVPQGPEKLVADLAGVVVTGTSVALSELVPALPPVAQSTADLLSARITTAQATADAALPSADADPTFASLVASSSATRDAIDSRFVSRKFLDLAGRPLALPAVMTTPPTVTPTSALTGAWNTGSSGITTPTEHVVQGGPVTITGAQAYDYSRADTAASTGYVAGVTLGNEIPAIYLAFRTDAPALDFVYLGSASPTYRLLVDGQAVTELPQVATGSSGKPHRLRVRFADRRMRSIVLEAGSMFVKSVTIGVIDTIAPAPRAPISVAFMGDSYTASATLSGIARTCSNVLGVAPIANGEGGTGYNNNQGGSGGKQTFGVRLPGLLAAKPDALVVLGGINDSTGTLQADCEALIAAARATIAGLPVVIVGSQSPPTAASSAAAKSALLKAAAQAQGAHFVDMVTGNVYAPDGTQIVQGAPWVTGTGTHTAPAGDGNADLWIATDATHPYVGTTLAEDGWTYHGMRLAAALQVALPTG